VTDIWNERLRSYLGRSHGHVAMKFKAWLKKDFEVDKELEKRGHKFCRFADDCNTYVKSRKAGLRVMASMRRILEGCLKLKVNENKSAVDLVTRRKFLGFSFYFAKGGANIRIHEKSYKRFKDKNI
jgi:prophage antirepressor-like protein